MAYIKKVKGYLVSGLVFYTILVTYFLAQTAWNDDVSVKKRHGHDDGLLNVLYQEERRHLRSFKGVMKTYGGNVAQLKLSDRSKRDHRLADKEEGVNSDVLVNGETGRKMQGSYTTDFDDQENGNNNNTHNNAVNFVDNRSVAEPNSFINQGSRPAVDVEVEAPREDDIKDQHPNKPNTGNIIIEENVPSVFVNKSVDTNPQGKTQLYNSIKSNGVRTQQSSYNSIPGYINSKGGPKSSITKIASGKSSSIGDSNVSALTEYCDKIDAEQPHLCLSERVVYSHPYHVNITTNQLSFKPLGDLYIYSAFLDTRHKPAFIRLITVGPKGRNNVKRSGYWCAFSLPSVLIQRYQWNGVKEPFTANPNQATQLEYYAASVGHDRMLQFYIMSCSVPQKHLLTLSQFDSSRIHLVAGSKDSPLLETVQERIAVDIVNNQGLPWQQILSHSVRGVEENKNVSNNEKQGDNFKNSSAQIVSSSSKQQTANSTTDSGKDARPSSYSSNPNSIVSCVAPIFNSVGVVQIVEFLELTLLLGSQHIVMYTHHVTDDIRDVLAMYRYHGLVTVLPWTLSAPKSIWANGRDVALNDCLYRTMYRYEYALFHDMDEYFVPRITPDLPSFMNFLKSKGGVKPHKISDLVFSSAYFPPPNKLQSKNLQSVSTYTKDVSKFSSLRSVHRTYFNQKHALRMVRPVMAFRVGAGERKKTVFNISPRYAAVNHYSQCVNSSTSANKINTSKESGADSAKGNTDVVNPGSSGAVKKDSKPDVVCTNTKVDMFLWRMKERLIGQTKDSIRELNSKLRNR